MRKIWITVVCCFMLAAVCLGADYSVTRLITDVSVEKNGNCRVTQSVELDVKNAEGDLVIPVAESARKVTVTGPVGADIRRKEGRVYAKLKVDESFTGALTATVSYETEGQIAATEQGQQFTALLVDALWEVPTDRYSFTAVLPEEAAMEPSFFSGYHTDEVEDKLVVAVQGRAISGTLRGGLLDRESFTMQVDLPEGYFAGVGEKAKSSGAGQWFCGICGYLILAAALVYWFMFLRSSSRLHVQARTTPPEGLTPADVPYLLCGGKPDFALLVCHWGSLGYLTVTANAAGRVLLRKSMDMGTERREEEQKLFGMLFGSADVCEVGGSRYLKTAEVAQGVLRQYWMRRLFDRASGSPLILRAAATLVAALAMMNTMMILLPASGMKWLFVLTALVAGGACGTAVWHGCIRFAVKDWKFVGIGGGAALLMYLMGRFGGGMYLMLPALLLCVFVGIFTCRGGRRTASGSDVVEQTMGFCRFLGHAEDQYLVQMLGRDGQYFYTTMLYAAACGQGTAFARRFGDMELENCAFLTFSEQVPGRADVFYQRFEQVLKMMGN